MSGKGISKGTPDPRTRDWQPQAPCQSLSCQGPTSRRIQGRPSRGRRLGCYGGLFEIQINSVYWFDHGNVALAWAEIGCGKTTHHLVMWLSKAAFLQRSLGYGEPPTYST